MNKFGLDYFGILDNWECGIDDDFDWKEEERHYQEMMAERYIEPDFEHQAYDFSDFDGYDCDLEMKLEFGILVRR